jgi:hypothetical protein
MNVRRRVILCSGWWMNGLNRCAESNCNSFKTPTLLLSLLWFGSLCFSLELRACFLAVLHCIRLIIGRHICKADSISSYMLTNKFEPSHSFNLLSLRYYYSRPPLSSWLLVKVFHEVLLELYKIIINTEDTGPRTCAVLFKICKTKVIRT